MSGVVIYNQLVSFNTGFPLTLSAPLDGCSTGTAYWMKKKVGGNYYRKCKMVNCKYFRFAQILKFAVPARYKIAKNVVSTFKIKITTYILRFLDSCLISDTEQIVINNMMWMKVSLTFKKSIALS